MPQLGLRPLLFPEVMLDYRLVDRRWLGLWMPPDGKRRCCTMACKSMGRDGDSARRAGYGSRLIVSRSTRGRQSSCNCT